MIKMTHYETRGLHKTWNGAANKLIQIPPKELMELRIKQNLVFNNSQG